MQVRTAAGNQTVYASGRIAFRRTSSLAFVTGGRLSSIFVNEGELVRDGQLLAKLDMTLLDAELQRATAELQRREDELDRIQRLSEQGWVTRKKLEETQNAQASAAIVASTAIFNRNGGILKALSSGVVLERVVEPGQVLAVGAPVLRLGDLNSGYVFRTFLNDREIQRIAIGATAEVYLKSVASVPIAGQVVEIKSEVDSRTDSFAVEISLPNRSDLLPGQIGNVVISARPFDQSSDIILVPARAVIDARGGEGFVYTFDPETDRVQLQRVGLGPPVGSEIQVSSNLARETWIVVTNLEQIRDGMTVNSIRTGS